MGIGAAFSSRRGLDLLETLLWTEEVRELMKALVMQALVLVNAVLKGMRSRCLKMGSFRYMAVQLWEFVWLKGLRSVPMCRAGEFCKTAWSEFEGVTCLRSCFCWSQLM